jgi:hypothetical protein
VSARWDYGHFFLLIRWWALSLFYTNRHHGCRRPKAFLIVALGAALSVTHTLECVPFPRPGRAVTSLAGAVRHRIAFPTYTYRPGGPTPSPIFVLCRPSGPKNPFYNHVRCLTAPAGAVTARWASKRTLIRIVQNYFLADDRWVTASAGAF